MSYNEIWVCLIVAIERRATHDYTSTSSYRSAIRATTLIMKIENEVLAINLGLGFVQKTTALFLEVGPFRYTLPGSSRAKLSEENNNVKNGLESIRQRLVLGFQSLFYSFILPRSEKSWPIFGNVWFGYCKDIILCKHSGQCRTQFFASDRGYRGCNPKETISFLSDVLGATLIETHKRNLC